MVSKPWKRQNKQLLRQLPVSANPRLRTNLHFPPAKLKFLEHIYDILTAAVPRSAPGAYSGAFVQTDKTALMEVSCKPGVNLWHRRSDDERYTFKVATSRR